ncbi:MAG: energy-coupling factor ABC transporter ATP-binding protein [Candidatus Bathyarchaeia archaeon]
MIVVKDLSYTYPDGTVALRGINLTIEDREYVALMGENGAGKTTLAKHFNGLLKPTEGIVLIDSVDTRGIPIAELSKKAGYVFQNPEHQLFLPTVEEEVSFAPKTAGYTDEVVKTNVEWALKILNLEELRDRSPMELGVGEQRRVSMASILSLKPKIFIMDEPTTGQDANLMLTVSNTLTELNRQGTTVIIITHDVDFVAESDAMRVITMYKGEIVADGRPEEILADQESLLKTYLIPPQVAVLFPRLGLKPVVSPILAGQILYEQIKGRHRDV